MLNISSVEDAYQYSLRAKEKLKGKHQGNPWGKEKQDSSTQAKPSVQSEPKPIDQKRRIGGGMFSGNYFKLENKGIDLLNVLFVG